MKLDKIFKIRSVLVFFFFSLFWVKWEVKLEVEPHQTVGTEQVMERGIALGGKEGKAVLGFLWKFS